jgi:hypothetical protein
LVPALPKTEFKETGKGTDVIQRMNKPVTPEHITQNLNAKLSPRPRTRGDQPTADRSGARTSHGASPPPRIAGEKAPYLGGYCISV